MVTSSSYPLVSLPDSIGKVEHSLYFKDNKKFKVLLEDVDVRLKKEQRVQRRLVILLAKAGRPLDEDNKKAVEKHYNQAKYQVLQDPKLVKVICEYINHD